MSIETKKIPKHKDALAEDEQFLSRWSRLKRESKNSQPDSVSSEPAESAQANDISHLTDSDMPPLGSLNEDSDYHGFFSPNVSEVLRQQALRKLFRSPVFNIRDGLDDYDDDFTSFAKLGDIITSDMRHQLDKQAQRLKDVAQAELADAKTENTEQSTEVSESAEISHEGDGDSVPSVTKRESS